MASRRALPEGVCRACWTVSGAVEGSLSSEALAPPHLTKFSVRRSSRLGRRLVQRDCSVVDGPLESTSPAISISGETLGRKPGRKRLSKGPCIAEGSDLNSIYFARGGAEIKYASSARPRNRFSPSSFLLLVPKFRLVLPVSLTPPPYQTRKQEPPLEGQAWRRNHRKEQGRGRKTGGRGEPLLG